ncbi:hypothetical protein DFH29DRAFT_882225 [Suillus ampliporus]|nr:hypothetical protein DFH29DRAFT_882225 [Suillus ampliporus]
MELHVNDPDLTPGRYGLYESEAHQQALWDVFWCIHLPLDLNEVFMLYAPQHRERAWCSTVVWDESEHTSQCETEIKQWLLDFPPSFRMVTQVVNVIPSSLQSEGQAWIEYCFSALCDPGAVWARTAVEDEKMGPGILRDLCEGWGRGREGEGEGVLSLFLVVQVRVFHTDHLIHERIVRRKKGSDTIKGFPSRKDRVQDREVLKDGQREWEQGDSIDNYV